MSRGGEGNGTANFGKGDRIKASVLEEMFLRGRGGGGEPGEGSRGEGVKGANLNPALKLVLTRR